MTLNFSFLCFPSPLAGEGVLRVRAQNGRGVTRELPLPRTALRFAPSRKGRGNK